MTFKKSKSASFLLSEEKEAGAPGESGEKEPIKENKHVQKPRARKGEIARSKRVQLLMSPVLYKELSKKANKEKMSLNNLIHITLEGSLK